MVARGEQKRYGGLFLFPFSLFIAWWCLITLLAHGAHVTASTHHLMWRKCGLELQKHPSLCSLNATHWCQYISNRHRWAKTLRRQILHLWARWCDAHIFCPVKKSKDPLFYYQAPFMEQRLETSVTPRCCSKILYVGQTPPACVFGRRIYSRCFVWNECVNYNPRER